jgi:L-ascorbate metabolism protein UlaG (beta-lactamase superfamily)
MTSRLQWLGHSTVLIELDGVRLLTDPLLRKQVLHLRRSPPLQLGRLDEVEAILVSHVHYDHLDLPSLRLLPRSVTVVVPRGAGGIVRKRGFPSVEEVAVGDELRVGSVAIRVTYAEHASSRVLGMKTDAVGFVVDGSQRIYFAGDTDIFPGMAELHPVDVALIPIWGWGPSLGPGHLDPREAAHALRLIRPQVAVPIHWGTYFPLTSMRRRAPTFLSTPVVSFLEQAAEHAAEVDVRVLRVGGTLPLPVPRT